MAELNKKNGSRMPLNVYTSLSSIQQDKLGTVSLSQGNVVTLLNDKQVNLMNGIMCSKQCGSQ
jgi:hypothetical protein